MPSLRTAAALVATALVALVQAQYNINPESVPLATRQSWCQSQVTACPLLCLQLPGESSTTDANDCEAASLSYNCVCGNGQSPNASEYSQTIPFFECQEYGNQCVANCNGDSTCGSACRTDNPCGAQNPTRVNLTTSSTSASTSATNSDGVVFNGLGSDDSGSGSGSGSSTGSAPAALDIGRTYGLAIVLTSVFAVFALVL